MSENDGIGGGGIGLNPVFDYVTMPRALALEIDRWVKESLLRQRSLATPEQIILDSIDAMSVLKPNDGSRVDKDFDFVISSLRMIYGFCSSFLPGGLHGK